jgi:integrase
LRKRREQDQSGYVRPETIGGTKVWVACYATYAIDPETEQRKRRIIRITPPLGNVDTMPREKAEKMCRKLVSERLGKQQGKRDGRVTFRWFAQNEYLATFKADWGHSTQGAKTGDLDRYIFPHLGGYALADITPKVLKEAFLNQLGESGQNLSLSVVKRAKTLVGTILDFAVEREYLKGSPAHTNSYKLPRCKASFKQVAELADIGRFLNAIDNDRDFVIMSLGQQGALAAEIFSMQLSAVHLENSPKLTLGDYIEIRNSCYHGKLVVGRTKVAARTRKAWISSVRMKSALIRLLQAAKGQSPDALLFPSRCKGKTLWSGTYLADHIRPLATKLGIRTPITFQVLRRSFATWVDALGQDQLGDLQRVLGHTPGSAVTRGVYVQPVDQRAAALVRQYADLCMTATKQHEPKPRKKPAASTAAFLRIDEYRPATARLQ